MTENKRISEDVLQNLMLRTQKGDSAAYDQLLSELNGLILNYCLKALPSQQLALDCRQDVLMSVHRMLHTYNGKRSFYAWIYAIIKNKVIDFYRKSGRRNKLEVLAPETIDNSSEPGGYEQSEAAMTVGTLLAELPAEFREPLVLAKFYGFDTKEIADRLGISSALVKVRVYRGLSKLRTIVEKEKVDRGKAEKASLAV